MREDRHQEAVPGMVAGAIGHRRSGSARRPSWTRDLHLDRQPVKALQCPGRRLAGCQRRPQLTVKPEKWSVSMRAVVADTLADGITCVMNPSAFV